MTKIQLKQLIKEAISESVKIGNEDDVRGNLGFFDRYVVRNSVKVVDDEKRRTYVWFIDVPLNDPEVRAKLKGRDLKLYLSDRLFCSGEFNQDIDAHVDIVRHDQNHALIRLVLKVEPVRV